MTVQTRPPILFLNIGWMKRYAGPAPDDPTRGNFGWLKQNTNRHHGHECHNFSPANGRCWGYHPGGTGTNINKLGASPSAESVDGVLVVWFARDPRINRSVIVGWYENATVHRQPQQPKSGQGHRLSRSPIWFKTSANAGDCRLLAVPEREFHIPSRNEVDGGYGQNPNWYGLGDEFLDRVWKYVQGFRNGQSMPKPPSTPPRNNDHELRKQVEDTAIRIATEFFESPAGGNRAVTSVELQAKGWDLEAVGLHDTLFVEVKGLSGSSAIAELTPNEFSKMQEHKQFWVLFVVTDCLTASPRWFDFRYMHDADRWETSEGHVLAVTPKTAAIVQLAP